jgi:hypothetical protein
MGDTVMHPLRVERTVEGRLLRYAARESATEGRARRSVVVSRFANMCERVPDASRRGTEATMQQPDLNPGGDPPEDDLNEEVDGSPIPDPTQDDTGADDIPDAD